MILPAAWKCVVRESAWEWLKLAAAPPAPPASCRDDRVGVMYVGMEVLLRRAPVHRLPPRVPEEIRELKAAVEMLGAYIQVLQGGTRMKESRLVRLKQLLGTLPLLDEAKAWKAGLKELWSELAELEQRSAS